MKHKKIFTTGALLLACTIAGGGCGGGGDSIDNGGHPEQVLRVFATNAGYGLEWLEQMLDAFSEQDWVKEKYPYLVIPDIEKNAVTQPGQLMVAGPKGNSASLVVSCLPSGQYYETKDSNGKSYFENLEDIYFGAIPGESEYDGSEGKQLKDKMDKTVFETQIVETLAGETVYYGVPWVRGTEGIFYNKTKLEKYLGTDYELPRTTDELLTMTETLAGKLPSGDAPWCFLNNAQYVTSPISVWWAQYEGLQGYLNYWNGVNDDGEYSPDIFKQVGRLRQLEVLDSLIGAETGYAHRASLTNSYMQLQTKWITGKAGIFYLCGDWVENEMKSVTTDQTIVYLKNPVISQITEKCTSIKNDTQLSFVVDCVDAEKEYETVKAEYSGKGYGNLTEADYDKIWEARNMLTRQKGHEMFVPTYGAAKEVAKDFIRFTATDEAIRILMNAGKGFVSPFKYEPTEEEYATFSELQTVHQKCMKNAVELQTYSGFRLYQYGGLTLSPLNPCPESAFTAQNEADRKTPQQIFDEVIEYYTANDNAKFNEMLMKAGLM